MRRTTIAALALAVLVGGWILLFEREEPDAATGQPVFAVREDAIQAVVIGRPEAPPVRLERRGDGFTVSVGEGPPAPADAAGADLLLQNIASLRFERDLGEVAEEELAGFGLAPPGLQVGVETGVEALPSAGFGNQTPAPGNRYLRFGNSVLVVPGFARENFDKDGWDLRDKRVLRFEEGEASARRLRLIGGDTTVELRREAGNWRIIEPFAFAADSFRASQLASRLLDAEMAGIPGDSGAAPDEPGAFGLDPPRLIAELEVVAGPEDAAATKVVRFGSESRTPPGVFGRVEGEAPVFVVRKPLVEELEAAVRGGLAEVRSMRIFRFAAFRAVELRVESPDAAVLFHRSDDEDGRRWTMETGGKEPDPAENVAVENLLYGLNSPEAEEPGAPELSPGARWTFSVREDLGTGEDEGQAGEPETVRFAISDTGRTWALRDGDDRIILVPEEEWSEIMALFETAVSPPEDP